jgi:hypothetical protein
MGNNWKPAIVGGTDVNSDQPPAPKADRNGEPIATIAAYSGLPDNMFSKSFFRLPFVTLPAEEAATWGEFWERADMWNDKPTANGCEDYQRGRRYARSAVEAIRQERATSRCLEITIEHMLGGAFRRRGPKGRLCRQLSSAETAFLQELCSVVSKP